METILINGISAKSGGGKSILTNLLFSISNENIDVKLVVIVPRNHGYEKFSRENILVIPYSTLRFNVISQILYYLFDVHKIIKKHKISLILNLADIIIPTKSKQLYFFDWAYATYPDTVVWKLMNVSEWLYRKFKLFLFKKLSNFPTVIYAQTETIKERLQRYYHIKKLGIIPNAVSLDNLSGGVNKEFNLPKNRFLFLCLSKYYVHKNIESFVPVARLIKKYDLPFSIIITIKADQHKNARKILELIEVENLKKILINLGEVEMRYVPSLYQQTHALLLPTLLESFSGTYVEAMYHKRPIFTSHYDFAVDVCGDSAIYFNPLKTEDIFQAINFILNKDLIEEKVNKGVIRLKTFPQWSKVAKIILDEINNNL